MIRWFFALVVLPVLLLAGLFFGLTDARPSLDRSAQVSLADLDRGRAIVSSLGLRRMREGEVRQLALTESDLDKGISYLASHLTQRSTPARASARIELSRLIVRASLPLPIAGLQRHVNLELGLVSKNDSLEPDRLRIGKLALPARLTGDLLVWSLTRSPFAAEWAAARTMLNSAQISGQTLALSFTWRGAALRQVISATVARGVDEAALSAYRTHLQQSDSREFSHLLGAAFTLARERSARNDPVIETRVALTSLAEKVLGGRLLSRRGVPRSQRNGSIKLAGRDDFAQHFALSAFLAATGGENLSDMAGLYKELKDAQGGSGFSFADLAADRAGSHLGESSTRSSASAVKMQNKLAGVRDAKVFFPPMRGLPEFMKQAEFNRRFGDVGQPAYQKMVAQIETRIAALPLYSN